MKNITSLLKPQFNEEGSNSRTFVGTVYTKFFKYMREAGNKSV